ncbi:MAG: hypothetical protein IT384_29565 [Deltaproteobacteria bacterium]|nr:hypothetical protein [Deltaproteobacteria bacterium]
MSEHESDLSPLPEDILDLLEGERKSELDVAAQKARVFAGIAAQIGGAGTGGGEQAPDLGVPPSPVIAGGGASALFGAKALVAIAFTAGAIAGGTAVHLLEPEPPARIIEVPVIERAAPVAPEPGTPPPPATPVEPSPAPPRAKPERAKQAAPVPASDRERSLIERARTALQRRAPAEAHAALLEHQHEFARGRLAEEREALLALTLLALERRSEADVQARRFRAQYPGSIFLPALDAELPPK